LLAALYLTAAVGFLARLLIGFRFSRRLLLPSETVRDQRALLLLQDLAAAHSIPWPLPRLCASRAVAVPITIGAQEPAILLPCDWQSWDDWKLRAVLAHELAHIRRGDWRVTLAASVNRCLFWFHPLAWWLERRLSALAEDACDEVALLTTGDAPRYASTILEFAAALQASGGRLAQPGVAMARSSQVSRRIHRILETRQLAPGILRKSSWAAILACALPLIYSAAALQVSPRPSEPAPDLGMRRLLEDGYKMTADQARQIEQQLTRDPEDLTARTRLIAYYLMQAMPDPWMLHVLWLIEHHPESAQAISYPTHNPPDIDPGKRQRVKSAWLQQADAHPQDAAVLGNVAEFIELEDPFAAAAMLKRARDLNPIWTESLSLLYAQSINDSQPPLPGAGARPMSNSSFAAAVKSELESTTDANLVGSVGQHLAGMGLPPEFAGTDPLTSRLRENARANASYGEFLLKRAQSLDPGSQRWPAALVALRAASQSAAVTENPSSPPAPPPATGIQRIRVGAAVQQSNLLHQVDPVYPPLARQARIQGVVRFNVVIAQDGHIGNITLINGHPLLVPAAQEAVKQWTYRPTLLNDDPVEVATVIDVNFMLPHEN
jgi:TonB family protein